MVSVANPDYLAQSQRVDLCLLAFCRNGVPPDLRKWIVREYLMDPKIPKRVPSLFKHFYDTFTYESTECIDRMYDHRFFTYSDTKRLTIDFVVLFLIFIISIILLKA